MKTETPETITVEGVVYVRKDKFINFIPIDVTRTECVIYENDKHVFAASVKYKTTNNPIVEITFKEESNRNELCDNETFLRGVLTCNQESEAALNKIKFNQSDIVLFRSFLNELKKIGWL